MSEWVTESILEDQNNMVCAFGYCHCNVMVMPVMVLSTSCPFR